MKKIKILLSITLLILSLVGCGSKTSEHINLNEVVEIVRQETKADVVIDVRKSGSIVAIQIKEQDLLDLLYENDIEDYKKTLKYLKKTSKKYNTEVAIVHNKFDYFNSKEGHKVTESYKLFDDDYTPEEFISEMTKQFN